MKKITLIAIAVFTTSSLFAQSWGEGSKVISVGYGMPNLGKSILKTFNDEVGFDVSGVGPLHLKFEYGLSEKIGVGLSVNYVNFGATWTDNFSGTDYTYDVDVNGFSVLARMNLHFGTSDKLDPYWGFGVGYKNTTWKVTSNDAGFTFDPPSIPFGFETTLGMRYYLTDNIGLYSEFGIAKSVLQGGVVAKF